jgi:hypothetical protein
MWAVFFFFFPYFKQYRTGFANGMRHGYGIYATPAGERYEGAFVEDTYCGQGTYWYCDAARNNNWFAAKGQFYNNKLNGYGYEKFHD